MSARYLLAACFLFLRASAFAAPGCLFRFKGSYRDSGTQFVPVVIAFPGFIWIGGMTGSLDAADQIKVSLDVLQKGRAWRWSYAGDFKPSVWPQADLRWRSNKDDPKCQVSVWLLNHYDQYGSVAAGIGQIVSHCSEPGSRCRDSVPEGVKRHFPNKFPWEKFSLP